MDKVAHLVVFISGITALLNAAPVIKYMTECERLAHTECVMKIGSSEEFIQKCKPTDLVACLKGYLSNEACSVKDKDTLPTIKSLISSVEKKFQKDPKFCQKKKKHEIFVNYLQDYFTVQGDGIEYTEQRKIDEEDGDNEEGKEDFSGSGDDSVPDDTEKGDDEDTEESPGTSKTNTDDNNTSRKKKKPKDGKDSDDNKETNKINRKTSDYWKETSKRINKERSKNDGGVQLRVYFDDPAQYKRNAERRKNNISESLKTAWRKLKQRYQRWFLASKFNKVS